MRPPIRREDLVALGLGPAEAASLATRVTEALRDLPKGPAPRVQERAWRALQEIVLADPNLRWSFPVHRYLYRVAYDGRRPEDGPGPAWFPTEADVRRSNLGQLLVERDLRTYHELHRWSAEHREEFWAAMVQRLGIVFREPPQRILDPASDVTRPVWLPGASLNIAESCFRADPTKPAVLYASESSGTIRTTTYGELRRLASRVANGLDGLGVARGEGVAVYMPMTQESVAIYLGTVLAGRYVVGIADASSAPELAKRVRLGGAKALFTSEAYVRDGKELRVYEKAVAADAPRTVVLPRDGQDRAEITRAGDLAWSDFLPERDAVDAVACRPSDVTNVLFSSGTTKDPKAIPWTHVTPIKAAADAYLHQDVQPADVLAWPTSFGWMMGPWLTYASLVNGATMALYVGETRRREFGAFVQDAGVTMLGVVPKLVRGWMTERTMEGLDWSRVRLFSSTAETSTPEEMLYLMFLAGYRPIVEYCGGTEIGGGYITGTVVQPCAPSTFTTPALGLDFVILDEGRPAERGEVFLVPPSMGLSNDLLNYDHGKEYYAGVARGPEGQVLRRHGDQVERLGGGFYRHHGRIDDTINLNGVKTSAEEVRSVLPRDLVADAKPAAVDVDGSGQHVLVIYAVPRDPALLGSGELKERLRREFRAAIRERLNPLLAQVHDVVLVSELPQAGPGKTRTQKELEKDYLARVRPATVPRGT